MARELRERQRAAADARDRRLHRAANERGQPVGAGPDALGRLDQHAQHRHLAERAGRIEVQRKRALERCERELVWPKGSLERMAAKPLDQLGAADDDPGLRAAEQLVAREADEVGSRGHALRRGRLVPKHRLLLGSSAPEPRSSISGIAWRAARRASASSCGRSVKPTTRKLDWWTRRIAAVPASSASLVVRETRAIGRADLDEPRARTRQHVGDAEAVADLHQLAARDEHVATLGERGEGEQQGGRVVVDDERGLGAGQPPQRGRHVILPRAARARRDVVLEVGVAAADLLQPLERRAGKRRAAEVRVQDDAGRVQDAPEARARCRLDLRERPLDEVARLGAGADLLPRAVRARHARPAA